jgi:hypothetical protein
VFEELRGLSDFNISRRTRNMAGLKERLINQARKLDEGDITDDTVSLFMPYLRQHADEAGDKSISTFRLYADWCVHHQLDRLAARGVLGEIQDAFERELSGNPGARKA